MVEAIREFPGIGPGDRGAGILPKVEPRPPGQGDRMVIGPLTSAVLADREVLYFFRQAGCPSCEAALPELYRFMAAHPAATVLVLDAAGPYPAQLGIKIRATPTYLFRRGEEGEIAAGVMKSSEIERWIRKIGGSL